MSAVLDILGWAALVLGGGFCLIGAIGLNRMPDVFTRMHAVSVSDTLGVGLLVVGMLTQTEDFGVAFRLILIVVVAFTTGAVATHALARAALHDGEKPLLAGADGKLRPTDCAEIYPELGYRLATPLVSEAGEGEAPVPASETAPPDPYDDREEGPPSNS